MSDSTAPVILDAKGNPIAAPEPPNTDCPRCGANKDKRGPAGGMGVVPPACQTRGYVFHGEVWNG